MLVTIEIVESSDSDDDNCCYDDSGDSVKVDMVNVVVTNIIKITMAIDNGVGACNDEVGCPQLTVLMITEECVMIGEIFCCSQRQCWL